MMDGQLGWAAGAEPVPGDGVRPRRSAEPRADRPEDPAERPRRLGHPDRARHELLAQRRSHLAHPPRPQVLQR